MRAGGATAPLLNHAPEQPDKPVHLARESVQGVSAAALDLLMAGEVRIGPAA
jgi:hypothetical protein